MSMLLNAFGQPFTGSKIRGVKQRSAAPMWPGAQQQLQPLQPPLKPNPETPIGASMEMAQEEDPQLTAQVGNMFSLGDPSKGPENLFRPESLPDPSTAVFGEPPPNPLGGPAPLPRLGDSFDAEAPDPLTGVKPLPKFGGFRANGGPVSPNKHYVVGERGPEVFIPQQPGRIVPMNQRQQPAYDPMAQMMQILQFALQQNQQGQQQQNQDRSFGLEQQQLDMQSQRYDQQFAAQQAAQEQQQQQAIISALSRMENKDGFQDPTALYQYLQQQGIQIPGLEQMTQPTVDPAKAQAQAQWAEIQRKLSQQ